VLYTTHYMLNPILISFGIVIMVFAVIECIRLININIIEKLHWQWYIALTLIIFFLIGYIAYFFLLTTSGNAPISSMLVSFIFFFGAIFVITILTISYQLIKALTKKTTEISLKNITLEENSGHLVQQTKQLEETQQSLKDKNSELKKTLEDFYTLRIDMGKAKQSETIDEENRKIKEKLDSL
jgi:hypothetical protein